MRKYIMLFTSIIILSLISCAITKSIPDNSIPDIHGHPIIRNTNDSTSEYISENGQTIIVYINGIEFNGGKEYLKQYLDSCFYSNPNYYKHSEFNVVERFFILFDSELNIRDVRIMYRSYGDNKRYYYDRIFVDAIKNTIGKWHKIVEDKKWYIYFHHQRIY